MICSICGGLVRWNAGFTKTRCGRCGAINAEIRYVQPDIKPAITREVIENLKESMRELGTGEDFYLHATPEHITEAMDVLLETGTVCICPCRGCGKPIVIKDLRHFDPDSHYCGESQRRKP